MNHCVRFCAGMLLVLSTAFVAYAAETVTARGGVAIGRDMRGGTINIGVTEEQLRRVMKETNKKEREKSLKQFVQQLNAQNKDREQAAFTTGAVQTFLATLTGKQVAPEKWSQVFGELSRHYLELEARIKAIPVINDKIGELVKKAETAREAGEFEEADKLLAQAEDSAIESANRAKTQLVEANRRAADILAARGSLALVQLERDRGAAMLVKAFKQRADDVSDESLWWLFDAGAAWLLIGNSKAALNAFQIASESAQSAVRSDSRNTQWQRDLSISYTKIGDVQVAQGETAAALKSYQDGLLIRKRLAESDSRNTQWQRDLIVSYDKLSKVTNDKSYVDQALTMTLDMQRRGVLVPGDAWMIEYLKKRLAQ